VDDSAEQEIRDLVEQRVAAVRARIPRRSPISRPMT